jgi:hypothetical protein
VRTGDGTDRHAPIGVLSLVVVDDRRPGWMLLGVRRPSALSTRHPGVLSTPTMRLPADTFAAMSETCPDPAGTPGMHPIDGPALTLGRGGRTASNAALVLESLLAAKLGLADALGDGRFHAAAYPRYLSLDEVGDPLGTERGEWTAMLTYEVRVLAGVPAIPPSTGGYQRLVWVDAAKVPQALAQHDALLLDETLDATEVCVQGLCVRVAAHLSCY